MASTVQFCAGGTLIRLSQAAEDDKHLQGAGAHTSNLPGLPSSCAGQGEEAERFEV